MALHRDLLILLLVAALMPAFSGCDGTNSSAQVRGKVVSKDGPLPVAGVRVVRFEPTADSTASIRKGASGAINDDGTFEIFTRRPGDGVILGKYAVTFAFYPGAMDRRSLIPEKYTKPATTPHVVVVEDDIENLELEIETQGAAGKAR